MTTSFNPIPQFSYGDEWERTRARQQRNNQPYQRVQQLSDQQAMQNASRAGDGLKALTKFSNTLLNKVVENQKKRNEEDRLKYLNKGFEEGWSQSLLDEFSNDVDKLKEDKQYFEDTANDLRAQGADFEAVDEVLKMNPWQTYGYAQGLAKAAAERYPTWLEEQMMTNDTFKVQVGNISFTPKNAEGLAQKRAALSALRTEFLRVSGVAGLNPGLLEESAFKQMRKDEGELMGKYKKAYRRERSLQIQNDLYSKFETDNDLVSLLDGLARTFDNEGNEYLGYAGAWGLVDQHMTKRFDAGTMTEDQLEAILDGKPSHGGGKTFRELYPTKAAKWEEERDNQETKNLDDKLANQKAEGKKIISDWRQFVITQRKQGQPITEAHLTKTAEIYKNVTGQEADFLKDFKTREDMDDIQARKQLKELRKQRGFLIIEDLTPYSGDIYQEFIGLVKQDEPLSKNSEDLKTAERLIKGLTNDKTELSGDDRNSYEYELFYTNALEDYKAIRKDQIIKGLSPSQAHTYAIGQVRDNAKLGERDESIYSKDNFQVDLEGTWEQREDLGKAMKELAKDPSLYNVVQIPDIDTYIEQAEKFRDQGGEIPEFFELLAMKFPRLTAFDIMNGQLRARGLEPIAKPLTEQLIDLEDPDFQRLLRHNPTPLSINQANIEAEEKAGVSEGGFDNSYYVIPGLQLIEEEETEENQPVEVSGEVYEFPVNATESP